MVSIPSVVTGHLRRFGAPSAGPRLVCFPHAGGAANFFRPWSAHVKPGTDLVAVQYPGRQDLVDLPHPATIQDLAAAVAAELAAQADPAAPTILFGHSLGAGVAFETAHALVRSGLVPDRLVVSARPGPADLRPTGKDAWPAAELWRDMVTLGGTPPELADSAELRDIVVPVLRRDYRLADHHDPTPDLLPIEVVALTGANDPEATPDEMRSWSATTDAAFRHHVLPGGHFYLSDDPADTVRLALG